MLFSRGQKIENIAEIELERLFVVTFLVSFFMPFLEQKLIFTVNIYLTSCSAHFLNKIIY